MTPLLETVQSDIRRLKRRRSINALVALAVTSTQILFSSLLLYFTVIDDMHSSTVSAMLSTFTITVDQALRVRENAAQDHQRLVMLRHLEKDILHPDIGRDPLWQEYQSIHEQEDISYVHAALELCF